MTDAKPVNIYPTCAVCGGTLAPGHLRTVPAAIVPGWVDFEVCPGGAPPRPLSVIVTDV